MSKSLIFSPLFLLLAANVAKADPYVFCQYYVNGAPTHAVLSFSSSSVTEDKTTFGDLQFVGTGSASQGYGHNSSEFEIVVSNSKGPVSKLKIRQNGEYASGNASSTIYLDGQEAGELFCTY